MKTKSPAYALCLVMLLSLLLTGCATVSSAPRQSWQIYQPRVLHLPAGQPVQTAAGIYRPQVDEVWHSAAAYQDLENQLINTAAALAQERNRSSR
jgi:hypothetical protein